MNTTITLIIMGAIIALILIKTIRVYNVLVKKDTDIQVQKGQIDTTLQKRDDLVRQLSVLTKKAAMFEERTQTTSARERGGRRGDKDTLPGIQATSERYPELNSIKANFVFFQRNIAELEALLKEERGDYNDLVGDYKVYVRTFPVVLFAVPLGYRTGRYEVFSTEIKDKPEFWEGKE